MSSRPFLYLCLNQSYVPVGRVRANNVFKADTVSVQSDLPAVIRPTGYSASCAELATVGKIYFKMRDNEPNNCEWTILKIKTHDNIKLHWLCWLLASIVSSKNVQSQNWIIKSFFRSTRNFFVDYLTRQRWTIKILVIFLWDVTLEEDCKNGLIFPRNFCKFSEL